MIDFNINESQKMILESLDNAFSDKVDFRKLNQKAENLNEYRYGYEDVSKLGYLGMLTDEKFGGFGLDFFDFCLFMEKWGYYLCNGPIINNLISGIFNLQNIDKQNSSKLIEKLSSSKKIITSSISNQFESKKFINFQMKDNDFILSGKIVNLEFFNDSTDTIIVGKNNSKIKLFIIPNNLLIPRNEKISLIGDKVVELVFNDYEVEKKHIIDFDVSEQILEQIFNLSLLAQCSESIGLSQKIFDKTIEYISNREAFGKKIGGFQSLQHKCSEIFISINETRELIRNTSKNIDTKEFSKKVSMTKIKCDTELDKLSWLSHQLHGAIGFTWDYGLHLLTKKILINKSLGGDLEFHSKRLYPDDN
ncbi:MAG: acyl-CoA dehydrogenase family protein [Dehalococcoidia bacterium]|nr:acyl-CoA dehydrogenase family protein [Dehalococcoidia bacterium]